MNRVKQLLHFLFDQMHYETPRMQHRPKFGWQEMLEMMERYQITAPYPHQRQWVIDALESQVEYGGFKIVTDPRVPRNQMWVINPAQILYVPPDDIFKGCHVPW